MTPADALYLIAGGLITTLALVVGLFRRWLVFGWAYHDQIRECEGWKRQCDESIRLASQATTIAEQLARSMTAHLPNQNSAT